jgi:hypothetical protein
VWRREEKERVENGEFVPFETGNIDQRLTSGRIFKFFRMSCLSIIHF